MSSAAWPVHIDPSHLYFITTRAVKGAHIFRRDIIKRILVDCLNVGRILGQYELFAYVLMPNHIHFLVRCLHDYTAIDVVREYKKAAYFAKVFLVFTQFTFIRARFNFFLILIAVRRYKSFIL